jgi:hypothetical protein
MVDCPRCGAGVPADLAHCPVCGARLEKAARTETDPSPTFDLLTGPEPALAGHPGQSVYRRASMSINTSGVFFLFLVAVAAFLAFVYFLTR